MQKTAGWLYGQYHAKVGSLRKHQERSDQEKGRKKWGSWEAEDAWGLEGGGPGEGEKTGETADGTWKTTAAKHVQKLYWKKNSVCS